MKNLDLSGIDLGQIQAFLMVGSTKNFTKAAELLHTTQPVVSKRVAALENMLGLQLFIRWRRTVRLTPAGEVLYEAWNTLISQILEPVNKANACQKGYTQHLTVAYCASAYPHRIGEHFKISHPDINLFFVRMHYPVMLQKLLAGEIDAAFYGIFGEKDFSLPPLRCQVLKRFPLVACMLSANPLSQMEELDPVQLRDQEFIMLSPLVAPSWLAYVTELCIRNRFTPQVSLYVEEISALVMNLRNDHSIFLTDRYCTIDTARFEVCLVPIRGTQGGTLLAWNQERESSLLRTFIQSSAQYWEQVP